MGLINVVVVNMVSGVWLSTPEDRVETIYINYVLQMELRTL